MHCHRNPNPAPEFAGIAVILNALSPESRTLRYLIRINGSSAIYD